MSEFLGHIHYWLYKKIKRVIEREQLLYNKAEISLGSVVEELRDQVWQTYGEPLPDEDLAQLIDQSNIHGWLQRQINLVEVREASFIKQLLDRKIRSSCFESYPLISLISSSLTNATGAAPLMILRGGRSSTASHRPPK